MKQNHDRFAALVALGSLMVMSFALGVFAGSVTATGKWELPAHHAQVVTPAPKIGLDSVRTRSGSTAPGAIEPQILLHVLYADNKSCG